MLRFKPTLHLRFTLPKSLKPLLEAIRQAGGRALIVGGFVRDVYRQYLYQQGFSLHRPSLSTNDIDIEVFNLAETALVAILQRFGPTKRCGKTFHIWQVAGLACDFNVIEPQPGEQSRPLATLYKRAAKRRDLTINSMALDPLQKCFYDPYGGKRDIQKGILRATHPTTFSEDPLRGFRVAYFIARFAFKPTPELRALCQQLCLKQIPKERIFNELKKILLSTPKPATALKFLAQTKLLKILQPLTFTPGSLNIISRLLKYLPGYLKKLTKNSLDLHSEDLSTDRQVLALTIFTYWEEPNKVRDFLEDFKAPKQLTKKILALRSCGFKLSITLVNRPDNLALLREAERAKISLVLLIYFTELTLKWEQRFHPYLHHFWLETKNFLVALKPPPILFRGRDLKAYGLKPGPRFKTILERLEKMQDQHPELTTKPSLWQFYLKKYGLDL